MKIFKKLTKDTKNLAQETAQKAAQKIATSKWKAYREADSILHRDNVEKWRLVEGAYGKLVLAIEKRQGDPAAVGSNAVENEDVSDFLLALSPNCNDKKQAAAVLANTKKLLDAAYTTYITQPGGGYIDNQTIFDHFNSKYENANILNKAPDVSNTTTTEITNALTPGEPQKELNKPANPAIIFTPQPRNSQLDPNYGLKNESNKPAPTSVFKPD